MGVTPGTAGRARPGICSPGGIIFCRAATPAVIVFCRFGSRPGMMGAAPGAAPGAAVATGVGSLFCNRYAVRFDVFNASNGAAGFPAQPMLSAAAPRQKASIFDMRGVLDPLPRDVQLGVFAHKS